MKKSPWSKEEYSEYGKSMFDPAKIWDKPEALTGVRVLELAVYWNGPMVSSFLAELGAEVIKFELPPGAREWLPMGGDLNRSFGPEKHQVKGTHIATFQASRNKYHVTLDIAHPRGREIFKELALRPDTDVILDNLRAGGMDKMGLGYRQLIRENPRLIALSINGPGQWGPWSDMVSYDIVGQVMSGITYTTGFPEDDPQYPGVPTLIGNGIGDTVSALWGFSSILVALLYREKTGKGQYIEVSQPEALLRHFDMGIEQYSILGEVRERIGNRFDIFVPYYITKCEDGYVGLGANDNQFLSLCDAMGRPDLKEDPRFNTSDARCKNRERVYKIIDDWLIRHTREELREIADKYSFVLAPVFNAKDICEFPHYRERGAVVEVDDPYYGKMKVASLPPHFSETPARIKTICKPIGADNEYIYGKYLGYTEEDLARLREEGVI